MPGGGTRGRNAYSDNHLFDQTRLCKFYAKGQCTRGEACTFAHNDTDVLPQPDFFKSQLCADFARGSGCRHGDSCRYAHGAHELRRMTSHRRSRPVAPGGNPGATAAVGVGGGVGASAGRKGGQSSSAMGHGVRELAQEISRLQGQLTALQHSVPQLQPLQLAITQAASAPSTPAGTRGVGTMLGRAPKKQEEDNGCQSNGCNSMAAQTFSRQSTHDSSSRTCGQFSSEALEDEDVQPSFLNGPVGFRRAVTTGGTDENALPGSPCFRRGVTTCGTGEACLLCVKNTFLTVQPIKSFAAVSRRALSTPAGRSA